MEIATLPVGMFETNCYLLFDKMTGEGAIVDPGEEADRICDEISRLGFAPGKILLTHAHGDHIGAVEEMKTRYDIPLYAGYGAEQTVKMSNQSFGAMFGVEINCPPPDHLLGDGDTVTIGTETISVIQTPGHSPEGVCLYTGDALFCGDTLFFASIGRTDLPGGNYRQLIESIVKKVMILPDATICYPGHGPATTVGTEKRQNPFVKEYRFE